jgi:hypothetical protein
MPPQAAVELHVAKFVELLLLLPLLLELAAAEPLELLELLHPAASTTVPTAATVATIALFVRKVVPPMPPPGGKRTLSSWLDKWHGRERRLTESCWTMDRSRPSCRDLSPDSRSG